MNIEEHFKSLGIEIVNIPKVKKWNKEFIKILNILRSENGNVKKD
jgi:hypothetical protein